MTQTEYEQLHRWSLEQELQDPTLGPGLAAMRNKVSTLAIKEGYASPYHNQRPYVADNKVVDLRGGYLATLVDNYSMVNAGMANAANRGLSTTKKFPWPWET